MVMKLTVKTLKGSHFEIRVQPSDTVMAVKKNIEEVQGKDNYPCGQQLLIHNGKVLKDETTLADNKVSEDGFLVVMLSKSKTSGSVGMLPVQLASSNATPMPNVQAAAASKGTTSVLETTRSAKTDAYDEAASNSTSMRNVQAAALKGTASASETTTSAKTDAYDQAASNLVAGSNLEETIQQIMDIGGGSWDKETVTRALRAAYNNPERAVDYLYSGIPETANIPVHVAPLPASQATETGAPPVAPASGAPNSSPLNMFPQETLSSAAGDSGRLGSLAFLRENQQFQELRSMVQANPQILQPMLQELGKQNPQLLRMIQEHHTEFLQLINEPLVGDIFDQPPEEDMPHAVNVTPAEQEAIRRLEAMGFERALVIEAFLACDRNEELAANYLLENAGDFEDYI